MNSGLTDASMPFFWNSGKSFPSHQQENPKEMNIENLTNEEVDQIWAEIFNGEVNEAGLEPLSHLDQCQCIFCRNENQRAGRQVQNEQLADRGANNSVNEQINQQETQQETNQARLFGRIGRLPKIEEIARKN